MNDDTVRVAYGTAVLLGLLPKKSIDTEPTTAHFLTSNQCVYNCAYCTQARSLEKNNYLSRIEWPEFDTNDVVAKLKENKHKFKRSCLQITSGEHSNLIKKLSILPLSVSIRANTLEDIDDVFKSGAEIVSIAIDCANPEKYSEYRSGNLERTLSIIKKASEKYPNRMNTHIIIGLGETEEETVELMDKLNSWGVSIALFAFTPVKGTALEAHEKPSLDHYRRIQFAHHKITGKPAFMTTGCSDCNRPCYTEKASKLYNYARPLEQEEYSKCVKEASL